MKAFFRKLYLKFDWYWVSFVWWAEVAVVSLPGFPKAWVKRLLAVDSSWVTSKVATVAMEKFSWSRPEFLELASKGSAATREAIARSLFTPKNLLGVLLNDRDLTVRGAVLSNPNVNWREIRVRIQAGHDLSILSIVQNPNVPLDFLARFSSLPYLEGTLAMQKLESMDDSLFAAGLRELGYEELVGYPRAWALKVLALT